MAERDKNISKAEEAQILQHYDEMVDAMKMVVNSGVELKEDERKLLFEAYKKATEQRHVSLEHLSLMEKKYQGNTEILKLINTHREEAEKKLHNLYHEILSFLTVKLIPGTEEVESKIFYYNMVGELSDLLAKCTTGDDSASASNASMDAYKAATALSSKLPKTEQAEGPSKKRRLDTTQPSTACNEFSMQANTSTAGESTSHLSSLVVLEAPAKASAVGSLALSAATSVSAPLGPPTVESLQNVIVQLSATIAELKKINEDLRNEIRGLKAKVADLEEQLAEKNLRLLPFLGKK